MTTPRSPSPIKDEDHAHVEYDDGLDDADDDADDHAHVVDDKVHNEFGSETEKSEPTVVFRPQYGHASDWDKFWAIRTLLSTLWGRRFKHSSGAIGVVLTSWFANLMMLVLCWNVRNEARHPTTIPASAQVKYELVDGGWPMLGLYPPSNVTGFKPKNGPIEIGFAPCIATGSDENDDDPMWQFIDTFKNVSVVDSQL